MSYLRKRKTDNTSILPFYRRGKQIRKRNVFQTQYSPNIRTYNCCKSRFEFEKNDFDKLADFVSNCMKFSSYSNNTGKKNVLWIADTFSPSPPLQIWVFSASFWNSLWFRPWFLSPSSHLTENKRFRFHKRHVKVTDSQIRSRHVTFSH